MNLSRNPHLGQAIARSGMNLNEIARAAKLHPVTMSRVLNGHQVLCRQSAERLARVLGSTPEGLNLTAGTGGAK
jgi:plasmid maintenance system antidote protein VapI